MVINIDMITGEIDQQNNDIIVIKNKYASSDTEKNIRSTEIDHTHPALQIQERVTILEQTMPADLLNVDAEQFVNQ